MVDVLSRRTMRRIGKTRIYEDNSPGGGGVDQGRDSALPRAGRNGILEALRGVVGVVQLPWTYEMKGFPAA